jgi:hypothetical protein
MPVFNRYAAAWEKPQIARSILVRLVHCWPASRDTVITLLLGGVRYVGRTRSSLRVSEAAAGDAAAAAIMIAAIPAQLQ